MSKHAKNCCFVRDKTAVSYSLKVWKSVEGNIFIFFFMLMSSVTLFILYSATSSAFFSTVVQILCIM